MTMFSIKVVLTVSQDSTSKRCGNFASFSKALDRIASAFEWLDW